MRDRQLTATLFAWNDLLWSLLACFLIVAALLINQTAKKKAEAEEQGERSAGDISVYVFWPDGIDVDIDTHLLDPTGEHTFFASRGGRVWNLLRDDLGLSHDVSSRNFENAYARAAIPGDYIVNVHVYRKGSFIGPIAVEAEIRFGSTAGTRVAFNRRLELTHLGDEDTLFRFTIGADGHLVPGSLNHLFVPVAKGGK